MKRVLFILPQENQKRLEDVIKADIKDINDSVVQASAQQVTLTNAFILKEYDTVFKEKYPLLCLSTHDENTDQKKSVRACSRFPSEIKKDKLYLANMTNLMNKDYFQLTMLNIKTVFYMTPDKFKGLDEHFECVHIPIDEVKKPDIDFDMLSDQIQSLIDKQGPVLLLCLTGHLSGALAMKVCWDTNKTFTKELASMYVMQRRYELRDIEHWLFGQINAYIPPNKRISHIGLSR